MLFFYATIVATVPNQLPEIQVSASPAWEWDSLLWSVYLLGVLVNIFLFFKELITLYRLYEKSPKKKCEGYTWVDASSIKNPFSFWYLLFWNESPEQSEHHYILKHELAHIQQWHSLDKLILQLLSIVLWWHPMIYLFKRSFYELHEFLADRAAAHSITHKKKNTYVITTNVFKEECMEILGNITSTCSNCFRLPARKSDSTI